MSNSKSMTPELLELESKAMIEKINGLSNIYKILSGNRECESINCLNMIKQQYIRMCNAIREKEEYGKYKEIEEVIIKQISKVESNLDKEINSTVQNHSTIMENAIRDIQESENYQNFVNLDEELKNIETLKELLNLYSPHISKSEIAKIQHDISSLKFELLFRKQVEQLIYQNGGEKSNLTQYDNEEERKCFIEHLKEKMKSLTGIEKNRILKIRPNIILSNNELLQRLIMLDMKSNPYNYINLLKAKVFNAHLCNIGNNPFEIEEYLTKEKLHQLGFFSYGTWRNQTTSLKANKGNLSLLKAIVENIITDENISIIECENIYKKFGFECNPILVDVGQECVKTIYDDIKGTPEYEKTLAELGHVEKSKEGEYCRLTFRGLIYDFDETKSNEVNLEQSILKRRIIRNPRISKIKHYLQKQNASKVEGQKSSIGYICKKMKLQYDRLQDLEQLKNKKGKLTLEEAKKLLYTLNTIYRQEHIKYNVWNLLPLECMDERSTQRICLAPIPREKRGKQIEFDSSFNGAKYRTEDYYKTDLRPLWRKYQEEFKELGIDVKKYNNYNNFFQDSAKFDICVSLDDISDLPIDYEKVRLLSEHELEKIMEREEEKEK